MSGQIRNLIDKLLGKSVSGVEPALANKAGEFDLSALPAVLRRRNPTILEIGCNDGSDTLKFLGLFPDARIFAFEPDPRAIARFRQQVSASRVTLFETAISSNDGTIEFHQSGGLPDIPWDPSWPDQWDLSGSLKKPKEHLLVHPWCTFAEKIFVQSMKLDTWADANGIDAVDFIWTDVQGAEEDVIAGARQTLAATRYFYTEYSNQELYEGQLNLEGIVSLLPEFEVVEIFKNDVLMRNKRLTQRV